MKNLIMVVALLAGLSTSAHAQFTQQQGYNAIDRIASLIGDADSILNDAQDYVGAGQNTLSDCRDILVEWNESGCSDLFDQYFGAYTALNSYANTTFPSDFQTRSDSINAIHTVFDTFGIQLGDWDELGPTEQSNLITNLLLLEQIALAEVEACINLKYYTDESFNCDCDALYSDMLGEDCISC